jgi:hypothetical protein
MKTQPQQWKTVEVALPPSVVAIIEAAGGADPKHGGMPHAMAMLMGTLPWIAVALYKTLPPDEYAAFVRAVKGYMEQAWVIIGAENPPAAFDAAYTAARRSIN